MAISPFFELPPVHTAQGAAGDLCCQRRLLSYAQLAIHLDPLDLFSRAASQLVSPQPVLLKSPKKRLFKLVLVKFCEFHSFSLPMSKGYCVLEIFALVNYTFIKKLQSN